jgi:hypothetical protein
MRGDVGQFITAELAREVKCASVKIGGKVYKIGWRQRASF